MAQQLIFKNKIMKIEGNHQYIFPGRDDRIKVEVRGERRLCLTLKRLESDVRFAGEIKTVEPRLEGKSKASVFTRKE